VSMMIVEKTPIQGVLILTPKRHGDERGFFCESYSKKAFEDAGVFVEFVQDNHSLSTKVGTIRGLHFQRPPFAQDKLVRCGRGRIFDVVVDIRKGSPTFGEWFGQELSFENGKQLLAPVGMAHGFATLEPDSEIVYKCSNYYAPDCDDGLNFDDRDIGIDWRVDTTSAIISKKDKSAGWLRDLETPFEFES